MEIGQDFLDIEYHGFGWVQVLRGADGPDPGADPQAGVLQSRSGVYLVRKPHTRRRQEP